MGNNGLRTLGGSVSGVSSIAVRKSKMRKKKKKTRGGSWSNRFGCDS
jgi:hypothetical protein